MATMEKKFEFEKDKYYVVRCDRAGVFFGKIEDLSDDYIKMTDVRKIWYWKGACAVEQLAVDGVAEPNECQFTVKVESMVLSSPIQIIPCTDKAYKSLSGVKIWKS